ncbi:MAG TPA: hypothetical protein VFS00_33165, partial [Polyangiaceae bacterium]|nr:hypothetical protein [Polyangiaceae bacterium]
MQLVELLLQLGLGHRELGDGLVFGLERPLELGLRLLRALVPDALQPDPLVHAQGRVEHGEALAQEHPVAQAHRPLEELLVAGRLGHPRGEGRGHHVAVQRAVEQPDAVAGHGGPGRVFGAHRVGVGRLRVEHELRAPLEGLAEVRRRRVEANLLALRPADLAEGVEHDRDLVGRRAALAEVVALHQGAGLLERAQRLVGL